MTGTITDLQTYVAVNCRLIDAQTAAVFAAAFLSSTRTAFFMVSSSTIRSLIWMLRDFLSSKQQAAIEEEFFGERGESIKPAVEVI